MRPTPPDPSPAAEPPASPPSGPASPRRLGRRAFLGLSLGVAAAAAAGAAAGDWLRLRTQGLWLWRRADNYARAYSWAMLPPAERIRRHYDYLALDAGDVDRFVADYERTFGRVELRALEANRLLYTKFLLSTDFFVNGADETRPVRYVALHDPYVSPCWNPLAPRA